MKLLKEIDQSVKLRPFADLLEAVVDCGIDVNDEDIMDVVAENLANIRETSEDLYEIAQGMATGMGFAQGFGNDREAARQDARERPGSKNPRLHMGQATPSEGDYVFLGGGQGWGRVVRATQDSIEVKDKRGYAAEVPLNALKQKRIKHPKTGKPMMVWMEK